MILQSLTNYYEQLLKDGKVGKNGWSKTKVSYAITIDKDGVVRNIIPLSTVINEGNKKSPTSVERTVPFQKGRSRQISPNFMCDNAKYLLGVWIPSGDEQVDLKNKQQAQEYFKASKEYHCEILGDSQSDMAKSICSFFETWDFEKNKEIFNVDWEKILVASNLIFRSFETREEYQEHTDIQRIWESFFDSEGEKNIGRCLVTGKRESIARLHPLVKGVRDAQSSGAALVSFNASAFESYGKEQGDNAPVSEYAANAYGKALNYLLTDKAHHRFLGDTTVVFWAENGEDEYSDFFVTLLGDVEEADEKKVMRIMQKVSRGENCFYEEAELKPETKFYVLGLSPNAARISVRFFYNSTFGNMIQNINEHYQRMQIAKPVFEAKDYPNIGNILYETVNKKASKKQAPPILVGALMRSVLENQRYPAALYSHILLRIRAERDVDKNRNRAAIIKAYIIKNYPNKKEVINTMELNESTEYIPYVLGRLFAVLEDIQNKAIGKETVRDRFFNSACSTPAVVFPQLLKLKNSHMRVLERENKGAQVLLDKQLQEVMSKMHNSFPKNLSLEDQGIFMIGYYHQVQKRYEKKNEIAEEQEV